MASSNSSLQFTPVVPTGWRLGCDPALGVPSSDREIFFIDPFGQTHLIHFDTGVDLGMWITTPIWPTIESLAMLIAVGFGEAPGRRLWNTQTLTEAYSALPTYRKMLVAPPEVSDAWNAKLAAEALHRLSHISQHNSLAFVTAASSRFGSGDAGAALQKISTITAANNDAITAVCDLIEPIAAESVGRCAA